ncbi:hypothetical protein [Hymenobacter sp. 102]|uniref:exodeoxyribonuclease X C-terminal domain-containing protein n=1 Tax=Hymenobacter sp. 102 TaxID=3403152 RepID=UPI003CEEE9F2
MKDILANARFWQFDDKSIFPFGKHKGESVIDVFKQDPSYIGFCLESIPKFTLTTSGWNAIYNQDKEYFNNETSRNYFIYYINKIFEVNRILRNNTHNDEGRNRPLSTFINKIAYVNTDKITLKACFKRAKASTVNAKGIAVELEEQYAKQGYIQEELTREEENKIKFSVRIIDFKDFGTFKKYDAAYCTPGVKTFEVIRLLSSGLVVLALAMDCRNFRPQGMGFGTEGWIRILPDDADCVLHIANNHLTINQRISDREMTDAEIEADIVAFHERKPNAQKRTPEYYSKKKIPIYAPVNLLDEILESYTINRQAFPNKNLFNTTILYEYFSSLQFTYHSDEVDELTKQWYESKNNIKTYDLRRKRVWQNRQAFWRSEDSEADDDSDRENWEELTDGQNGTWEDWHEPVD